MAEGKRRCRILHTSDLHLVTIGDRACHSLEVLSDLAAEIKADLFIIAGDLFDHNMVDDELVRFVAEQLKSLPIHTIILPGNHDYLTSGSVFDRAGLWGNCDNVVIFRESSGEILDLPEIGVSLWGKSHDETEDGFRPMAGIPQPQGNNRWHIAVAHGYYVDTKPPLFPSYHISEEEIVNSGWDYIALGHVPIFRCVCEEPVKAYYSGSPSFASGSVAIVDLIENTGVQVTRYPMSAKPGEVSLPSKI